MLNSIKKYFPDLKEEQDFKLEQFAQLLKEWNEKINLISRKDVENIEINHILHSLAIAKYIKFKEGSKIMDLGSGGGLPGIPLSIIFPDSEFILVDRIGKKINASTEIINQLQLPNISAKKADVAEIKDKFHFIVNRGVMPQPEILKLVKNKISKENFNALPNGIISLKGGDLTQELKNIAANGEVTEIKNYFNEPFFETKKIVYTAVI